jgi:hypothetical protein
MEATQAATYERRVVDGSGKLLEREVFEVGISGEGGSVPLTITSFDKHGEPSKTTKVSWQQGAMAPARFIDAAIRFGDAQASIETDGPLLLYPKNVEERGALADVELRIKILKGIMRILGTRTKILVSGREVEPMPALYPAAERAGPYRITSRITARVFMLAIPVKRVEFETQECVAPSVGLIRHEIKLDDGSRIIMERIASSGPSRSLADARSSCGCESGGVEIRSQRLEDRSPESGSASAASSAGVLRSASRRAASAAARTIGPSRSAGAAPLQPGGVPSWLSNAPVTGVASKEKCREGSASAGAS